MFHFPKSTIMQIDAKAKNRMVDNQLGYNTLHSAILLINFVIL